MNPNYIRKLASLERGRRFLLEKTEVAPSAALLMAKAASANDPELLKIAAELPGDTLQNYEALGGTFDKEAIGAPMFKTPNIQLPQLGMGGSGMQGGGDASPSGLGAASKLQGPPRVPGVSEPKVPGQNMGEGQSEMGKASMAKHAVSPRWVAEHGFRGLAARKGARLPEPLVKHVGDIATSGEKFLWRELGRVGRQAAFPAERAVMKRTMLEQLKRTGGGIPELAVTGPSKFAPKGGKEISKEVVRDALMIGIPVAAASGTAAYLGKKTSKGKKR